MIGRIKKCLIQFGQEDTLDDFLPQQDKNQRHLTLTRNGFNAYYLFIMSCLSSKRLIREKSIQRHLCSLQQSQERRYLPNCCCCCAAIFNKSGAKRLFQEQGADKHRTGPKKCVAIQLFQI